MKVLNVHERAIGHDPKRLGSLIDSLASHDDGLWPAPAWPRMILDRPLAVGARGGHGPIRYTVEAYSQGKSVRFRFTGPRGFDGFHGCDVLTGPVRLRHTVRMQTRGLAILTWPLIFEPLHDALIEDAFTRGESSLGLIPDVRPWSLRVKILRWLVSGGRAGPPS